MTIRSDETLDTILGGALSVVQPRAGYRFSVDSILLARFSRPYAVAIGFWN
jgi:tRNA1(Val) A37 N6-methylase TrmN6